MKTEGIRLRLFKRLIGALLLIVMLGVGGGWWWLRSALPETSGTVALVGLSAAVEVTRDVYGVPTIRAQTRDDAYFALGYLHAQDRLFQMDLERRLGAGRLAEIFGPKALPADEEMRTLGFYREAKASFSHLSPEFQQVLESYAAGINARLTEHKTLPLEFIALHYRPELWQPADTLVFGKLLALELSGNYRNELLRARLALDFSPAQIQQLLPGYPKDGPVALANIAGLYRDLPLDRMLAGTPNLAGPTFASNNWVVDGAHSTTGKPLLANDPHLDFSIPGTWYLADLEAPGLSLAGATIPGTPLVVLGHNDRIAWGYTTTNADVEDLFIEKLDPAHPGRYLTPHGSAPFETRTEIIRVKGEADRRLTVRSTRHGPVISDSFEDAEDMAKPGHVLALEANFLDDDDTSAEAQWRLDLAGDWRHFTDALKLFVAPSQNIVYADVDGNIGLYVPGRIPIRTNGDGRLPVPGWTGRYDWRGWIPFDALPHVLNPHGGHIATANNKIVPDDYPFLIGTDYDVPFRAQRIEALLKGTPQQSIVSSTRIMQDDVSLTARMLLPLMLAAPATDARQKAAHDLLANWDGSMEAARPQPLLFTAWLRDFNRRIFQDKLGSAFEAYWNLQPLAVQGVLTRYPQWCADHRQPAEQACQRQLAAALDDALGELGAQYGTDMTAWHWGDAHRATFDHPLFSHLPAPLARLFDRAVPADGGNDTVDAGVSRIDGDAPYADVHGPGLRAIYDLSDLGRSVFMITPGQSGQVMSSHYDDLLTLWHGFQWLRLEDGTGGDMLTLVPADPTPQEE
jgi:penicillin amidase